ncbi:hypothetical protein ILT44_12385 [Microvirga sp. BT689]|uniref:hypothetical protein n=1 Tax=Microvirga arvi TaxID=2778731 RepID=UPI0019523BF2|nr:hypothetical protein [Microvirga arvi]MBM6580983.1 hypothetical protein [Microvirga arvi]
MKRFLLFAGTEASKTVGVNGFAGDYETALEAYVSLVDNQTPSEWWHILDTQTGEVVERRHLKVNGSLSFMRSDRIIGSQAQRTPITIRPTLQTSGGDVAKELEAGIRATVASVGKPNGNANGHLNGGDQ